MFFSLGKVEPQDKAHDLRGYEDNQNDDIDEVDVFDSFLVPHQDSLDQFPKNSYIVGDGQVELRKVAVDEVL